MLKRIFRIGISLAVFVLLCPGQESPSKRKSEAPKTIYPTAHGVLKSIAGSQFTLEVEEEHELKFHLTRKTRIFLQNKEVKPTQLEPGQTLDIDMQASIDGSFDAIRINIAPANPEPSK
jgi:hypothetical protein